MGSNPTQGTKRYGPYESNAGHLFYVDVYDNGERRSVWAHREVMEQHIGRSLNDDEVVHHKDEDKKNNALDNLEILQRGEHSSLHHKEIEVVSFNCAECGQLAFKEARNVRGNQLVKKRAGPFCGRQCAGRRNARLRQY